jgi:hypothetical protein
MTTISGSFELVRKGCKQRAHFPGGFLTPVRNGFSQVHLNLGQKPMSETVSVSEKPISPPLRGEWFLSDQTFIFKTCKAQGVVREHF